MFSHIKRRSELIAEVKSLTGEDAVKVPDKYHPLWSKLINRMMTYNVNKRPTFTEMANYFEQVELKIRNDLAEKYGFETVEY